MALSCAGLATPGLACGGEVFTCESTEQCGADGACELTGFCSFPDEECPSGRRYGARADAGLANTCVPTQPPTGDDSSSGVADPSTTSGRDGDDTLPLSSGLGSSGAIDDTSSVPVTDTTSGVGSDGSTGSIERVTEGLLVLYRFDEGAGELVLDQSAVDPPVDLTLEPENGSPAWVADGLAFTNGGIAHALGSATKIRTGCQATGELSAEAWVTAAQVSQEGPARLMTLSADISSRSFTMGHSLNVALEPVWIARLNTSTSSPNGVPDFEPPAIVSTEPTHLVFSRAADGAVTFWVDGAESLADVRDGDFSTWATTDQFAVGNEIDLMRPWLGVMHLVAVYDRALAPAEVAQNFAAGP